MLSRLSTHNELMGVSGLLGVGIGTQTCCFSSASLSLLSRLSCLIGSSNCVLSSSMDAKLGTLRERFVGVRLVGLSTCQEAI